MPCIFTGVVVKKIAFAALVLAALICGTWGYLYLEELKKPTRTPLGTLPDSCSILLEIKAPRSFFASLTQGNLFWEELQKIEDIGSLNPIITTADSLFGSADAAQLFGSEPLFIALYGRKAETCVYAFNISDVNAHDKAITFFENSFAARKISSGFYQCTFSRAKQKEFFLFADRGLFVIGTNKSFLEEIAANASQTLAANTQFNDAHNLVSKDKGLTLFIHQPQFSSRLWPVFFSGTARGVFSDKYEKWLSGDMNLEPADISVQGLLPADSAKVFATLMHQQSGDIDDLMQELPYNTSAIEAIHLSDYGQFIADSKRAGIKREAYLKRFSDSLSSDAETEIGSFIGEYIVRFSATTNQGEYDYGLVTVRDEEKAAAFLQRVADSAFSAGDRKVFLFSRKELFNAISGDFIEGSFCYVSLDGQKLFFANELNALVSLSAGAGTGKLSENERTMGFFNDHFTSRITYLNYCDVFKNKEKIHNYFSEKMKQQLNATSIYENIDALGLTIEKNRDELYYKVHAGFNPKDKTYRNTLWETLVDTDLVRKPVPFVNHRTGEYELICQDKSSNLYLMSNTGKILWKKKMGGIMLGDPQQIDYFANGKLQMIFVTENAIHLIDRNGNYVDGFPVNIKAGASGPLVAFDYDHSHNYRYWIPLKNNSVVCLNNNCKLVDGFSPVKVKAPVQRPVQHFLVQQMDYFLLLDSLGNIYLTNRKGESRAAINEKLNASLPLYVDVGKDASRSFLCYFDAGAKQLRKIFFNGRKEDIQVDVPFEVVTYCFDTLHGNTPLAVIVGPDQVLTLDLSGAKVDAWNAALASEGVAEVLPFGDSQVLARLSKGEGNLLLTNIKTKASVETEIRLTDVPASYKLIKGKDSYLIGYNRNKVFCIRP